MLDAATEEAEKHVLKTNEEFHIQMENRKKILKNELNR